MNLDVMQLDFDGHRLDKVLFRGEPCLMAAQFSLALGYSREDRVAQLIRRHPNDFALAREYDVLQGTELEDIKTLLGELNLTLRFSSHTPGLVILYRAGVSKVLNLTRQSAGEMFREWWAHALDPALQQYAATRDTAPLDEALRDGGYMAQEDEQGGEGSLILQRMSILQGQFNAYVEKRFHGIAREMMTLAQEVQDLIPLHNKFSELSMEVVRMKRDQYEASRARQKRAQRYNEEERTAAMRAAVYEFSSQHCLRCRCTLHFQTDKNDPCRVELDHVQPVAHGGNLGWDNVQALCLACHKLKTAAQQRGESWHAWDFRGKFPEFRAECQRAQDRITAKYSKRTAGGNILHMFPDDCADVG